ncbi:VOC family protein [Lysobacter maris]|uniref:VOC family protein n=1 Tax=Marilutibacter maris TaxID=1605891 RepID=A0A508B118_9GAMM|nr:VOC family protein [Lysobacter maris]KAB8198124.1 VOC family protein [Lysobacter maris]
MSLVRPITPHLWFDRQAREAAGFYCSVFPDSRLESVVTLRDTPSGDCDVVSFELCGQPFMAISAGPLFRLNPSVSFIVNFDPVRDPRARERLDATWAALIEGGQALMPLDAYPFSPRYGWVQDRYGLSWQLILSEPAEQAPPAIMPSLLFVGEACGQAEAAGAFYRSVFEDSQPGRLIRYPDGMAPDREGSVMFSDFRLGETWFAAMDSAREHDFGFNEAISFVVTCRDQPELDRYWAQLSSVPEAEQCGWCKDRFGVSWQVTPAVLGSIMASGDEARIARVTRAFLDMHKLDVAAIEAAAAEEIAS